MRGELTYPWGEHRSQGDRENCVLFRRKRNICAKLALHTHKTFQNQSLSSLGLPSQLLCWKSTQPYLTDSYGPELATSRDLPARVARETIPPKKKAGGQESW